MARGQCKLSSSTTKDNDERCISQAASVNSSGTIQSGKGLPTQSGLPLEFIQRFAREPVVKWKISWETESGQASGISHTQSQLSELEHFVDRHDESDGDGPPTVRDDSSPEPVPSAKDRSVNSSFDSKGSAQGEAAKKRKHAANKHHALKKRRDQDSDLTAIKADLDASDDERDDEDDDDEFKGSVRKTTHVRVDQLTPVYVMLFKMLQQRGCKKIAQAWIKKCEPRKQGNHPYNGGLKAKAYSDYHPKNPGKHTAPIYWLHQDDWEDANTTGCRHKEPDHVKAKERLNLMLHFLCLGDRCIPYSFNIDLLEESTKDIMTMHPGHFRDDAADVLRDIYRARRIEERYERGEIDGDTIIAVKIASPMRNPTARLKAMPKQNNKKVMRDIKVEGLDTSVTASISTSFDSSFSGLETDDTLTSGLGLASATNMQGQSFENINHSFDNQASLGTADDGFFELANSADEMSYAYASDIDSNPGSMSRSNSFVSLTNEDELHSPVQIKTDNPPYISGQAVPVWDTMAAFHHDLTNDPAQTHSTMNLTTDTYGLNDMSDDPSKDPHPSTFATYMPGALPQSRLSYTPAATVSPTDLGPPFNPLGLHPLTNSSFPIGPTGQTADMLDSANYPRCHTQAFGDNYHGNPWYGNNNANAAMGTWESFYDRGPTSSAMTREVHGSGTDQYDPASHTSSIHAPIPMSQMAQSFYQSPVASGWPMMPSPPSHFMPRATGLAQSM